jgi:hypothetical protein
MSSRHRDGHSGQHVAAGALLRARYAGVVVHGDVVRSVSSGDVAGGVDHSRILVARGAARTLRRDASHRNFQLIKAKKQSVRT